jgi:DNA-binding CsgD family transcriptional regulator
VTVGQGALAWEESEEVRELRTLADSVRDEIGDAARAGADGMRLLVGVGAMVDELSVIEPRAARSVWNMQPRASFDPEDPGYDLTESSIARGIETQLVTRASTLSVNPLLGAIYPNARICPVFLRAIIVDEQVVVVEGLDTVEGFATAWLTTRSDFVVPILEIWRRTLAMSRPLLGPGEDPPLTRRQVKVACLLGLGEKDQTIARRLGLSGRTVEREVRAILEALGARGRTEAVMLMRGRGINGRLRDRRL